MARTRSEEYRGIIGEALEQAAALMVRHLPIRQGLSLTTISVLSTLDRDGPVRLTSLAAGVGVSQPAMTEQVQRLTKQDLVTRVSDPADGRVALIAITDAGRELLADKRRAYRRRLADLLGTLSREDEAALALAMDVALPIIQRLIDHAAQADPPTARPRP